MSVWKLQCHFCGDTVSTFKLNNIFYKMHLEAVHNIQLNVNSLLKWALAEQGLEGNMAHIDVAEGDKWKDVQNTTSKFRGEPSTSRALNIPAPLLKMKGISVQRHVSNIEPQGKLDEMAINSWANGCEHGCRVCKKLGKTFSTHFKNGLLKHLQSEHKLAERDYKKEFKITHLMTKFSYVGCKECGSRVRRSPVFLKSHLSKHGLTIRSYWVKYIKQALQPIPAELNLPWMGPVYGVVKGNNLSGSFKCHLENCSASFDNSRSLNFHRAWHKRTGKERSLREVTNREDQSRVDSCEDLNPMDMLEVNMGNGTEKEVDDSKDGTNDAKTAVQLSYVGDDKVTMMDNVANDSGTKTGHVKEDPTTLPDYVGDGLATLPDLIVDNSATKAEYVGDDSATVPDCIGDDSATMTVYVGDDSVTMA